MSKHLINIDCDVMLLDVVWPTFSFHASFSTIYSISVCLIFRSPFSFDERKILFPHFQKAIFDIEYILLEWWVFSAYISTICTSWADHECIFATVTIRRRKYSRNMLCKMACGPNDDLLEWNNGNMHILEKQKRDNKLDMIFWDMITRWPGNFGWNSFFYQPLWGLFSQSKWNRVLIIFIGILY